MSSTIDRPSSVAGRRASTRGPEGPAASLPDEQRRDPKVSRRLLLTLLAYLECGSHKEAAHHLGIAEVTCRQRISQLMASVGAVNSAQAAWRLRRRLEAVEATGAIDIRMGTEHAFGRMLGTRDGAR